MHLFNLWSESYTWMVSYRTEESCLSSIPPGPTSTINLWKGSSLYILPNHHVNYVKPWKISREALRREFKNRLQQAYFPTLILVGRSLRHYESRRADASSPAAAGSRDLPAGFPSLRPSTPVGAEAASVDFNLPVSRGALMPGHQTQARPTEKQMLYWYNMSYPFKRGKKYLLNESNSVLFINSI